MNPLQFHSHLNPIHNKMKAKKRNKFRENDKNCARVGEYSGTAINPTKQLPSSHYCRSHMPCNSSSDSAATGTQEPLSGKSKTKVKKKKQKTEEGRMSDYESKVGVKQSVANSEPVPVIIARTVFTAEDEITILQSMIEFAKSHNTPRLRDFYPFLKGKLSADFSNSQVYDKIRRLRARYSSRLNKKCGEAPILFGDHDLEVYMISKNIWGMDSNRVEVDDQEDAAQVFCAEYPQLMDSLEWETSLSFSKLDTVKENIHLIGSAKGSEMEMEWMELKSKEQEIHSRKMNFKIELMRTVLGAMKKEGLGSSSAAM